MITDERFKDPSKTVNEFVNIISPTFGLTKGVKFVIKGRLKLESDETLRTCLIDVLNFLAVEYKK